MPLVAAYGDYETLTIMVTLKAACYSSYVLLRQFDSVGHDRMSFHFFLNCFGSRNCYFFHHVIIHHFDSSGD